jgi:ElaB/YqjD/DUF883 family membrane-anchored ribosome-binding protein
MARNGRERQTREDLRREAADRLAAVKRTAAALEDRLRERTEQVGEAIDRTRDQLHSVDQFVHRYRYAVIGGALGLGFALGRRGRRRSKVSASNGAGVRYVLVEQPRQRGVVRSMLGGVAALALRQGASWLVDQLGPKDEEDEGPLMLPPRRRARSE